MSDLATVLSVGRLYCDLIFTDLPRMPTMGTEVYAGGFGVHAGGGAFITAAHLAALGHPSALSAILPAPPLAGLIEPDLARAGLDLRLCKAAAPGDEPQATVALVGAQDRAFVTHRTGPAFPPLTNSPWVQHDEERLIKIVMYGLMGPLEVAGKRYDGLVPMTPFGGMLKDEEVASVLTFVRNHFGNKAEPITARQVEKVRESTKGRVMLYTTEEILKAHPIK